jgi:hypothetical protein
MLFLVPRYLCEYEDGSLYFQTANFVQPGVFCDYSRSDAGSVPGKESVWISSLFIFHNLHVGHENCTYELIRK